MARKVAIGIQDFEKMIKRNLFYVDKTDFIREWWENYDDVTLIARPRRFGKTLTMSMVETFFSNKYENRGDIFEKLMIWNDEDFRKLQGTYPVISLSFANIKERTYEEARGKMCQIIANLYEEHRYLLNGDILGENGLDFFKKVTADMNDTIATLAIHQLSDYLSRYYGKKVIILLDEYDTPMQEAYVNGYWNELTSFVRNLFNSTFKTNPYMERAIMTGITRVSKESIFSDLNNLEVVTTTSKKYAVSFGFTEKEVFDAMDEQGFTDADKVNVKKWYDGFVFGNVSDIYNPWSVINYLKNGNIGTYWANTSSNSLIGKLIRESGVNTKNLFENLLNNGTIEVPVNEQIVYNNLDKNEGAIWSLMLATGYLKVLEYQTGEQFTGNRKPLYKLTLTNEEVKTMFYQIVSNWFEFAGDNYNDFINALLSDDLKAMNHYMKSVCDSIFSYFDTGSGNGNPEKFYHGFVLGLTVDMSKDYHIRSNRESGFGRYDVMIYPKIANKRKSFILEFKVHDSEDEKDLQETVNAALKQIEEKNYAAELISLGFDKDNICKYGFAFEGKKVLIGKQEITSK